MGEGHSTAPRTGLFRLIPILAVGTIAVFLAACGGDEPTPAATPGESIAPPTVDIATPSPTPTPIAPTPTPVPTLVPFRPTATPSPTPTPAPTAIPQELIDELEAQLPTMRMNGGSHLLNDGRLLMYGGTLPTFANNGVIFGEPHPLLEVYDPVAQDWSLILPINIGLVGLNAVSLVDGSVLLFALRKPDYEASILWPARLESDGDNSPLPLYTVFRLDEEQGTYAEISTATIPRASPSIVPLSDGGVMLLGGSSLLWDDDPFTRPPPVTDVEIYNPATNGWAAGAPLPSEFIESRAEAGEDVGILWVGSYGDKVVVVIGGEAENYNAHGVMFSYDLSQDSWESLTEFGFDSIHDAPRIRALSGGRFAFFYGDDIYGDRIETFDTGSGEWSFASYSFWLDDFDPTTDEFYDDDLRKGIPDTASIVTLSDGRLFITGGNQSGLLTLPGVTTSVYDPSTAAWVDGPELSVTRSRHSAMVLPDGSVLLFGGITVWEENGSESVPTNSMEIISAASIAAVDTSASQAAGRLISSPLETCLGETGLEIPGASTELRSETTLSASDIMAQSSTAMDSLQSYSVESAFNSSQVNQFVHLTYTLNANCTYSEDSYTKPDRYRGRSTERWQGHSYLSSEHVVIGKVTYIRWYGDEHWTERETWRPIDEFAPHAEFLSFDTEDIVEDFRLVGTTSLDEVEVYEIRGSAARYEDDVSEITLWIGVDDQLLHRAYEADREPEAVGLSNTSDYLLVYHSFNEDFNIQPPPESEIAEPEE